MPYVPFCITSMALKVALWLLTELEFGIFSYKSSGWSS